VCPVPWATKPAFENTEEKKDKTYQEKTWDTYIEKHKKIVDNVNHPSHYNDGGIECIEAIEAQLTLEEYRGYLRGNCAKYLWRCNNKGYTKQDLQKCEWYLNRLLLTYED
jgi:formylmethanofuran dehydrogenase subunit B